MALILVPNLVCAILFQVWVPAAAGCAFDLLAGCEAAVEGGQFFSASKPCGKGGSQRSGQEITAWILLAGLAKSPLEGLIACAFVV